MLLDDAEEMGMCVAVGEDDCFAAEGTDFGSTDVEHIAVVCQERKGDVAGWGGESIAEAGTIDEERQLVFFADGLDGDEFGC